MIVSGGNSSGSITTRSYAEDGTAGWTANHGTTVYAVTADASGNVYTGGGATGYPIAYTTRKYTSNGELVWSVNHGGTVYGIAANSAGAVGTVANYSPSIRVYDNAGIEQWTANHGATVYAVAMDSAGNVYIGGDAASGYTTRKYNSSGELVWSVNHGAGVRCITVDAAGNVYTGGVSSGTATTRKYNSNGELVWSANDFATVYGIAVDSGGQVTVGMASAGYPTVRQYTSDGAERWTADHGATVQAVTVDAAGNVYIGGLSSGGYTTRKYNSSGELVWSVNHGATVRGIGYAQGPLISLPPGLPASLALALPTAWTWRLTSCPSLPAPLALAIPSPSEPPLSPELAGLPVAKVYRAHLSGPGGALLELPITSLQCTRRAGESTWLAITLSLHTAAWWTAIQARMGNEVVVHSGYRLADGSETMGLFLRATLTAAENEYGRDGASITLTARVIPTASTPQFRTLFGIRSQTQDNGRYTVICEPDPLIRPGDTVAADGASFVVHSAQYRISPQDGEMTVVEVA